MPQHSPLGLPLLFTPGVRERHGHAHHKHERRLNQVPEGAAPPGHMTALMLEEFPEPHPQSGPTGPVELSRHLGILSHPCQGESCRGHGQHDETAVGVQRLKSLRGFGDRC